MPNPLGPPPAQPLEVIGPSIREIGSRSGESSTYETRDTLQDKHGEDLFDYYAASQIALVDASTLAVARGATSTRSTSRRTAATRWSRRSASRTPTSRPPSVSRARSRTCRATSDERYAHPGDPVYRLQPDGQFLVRMHGNAILAGDSASPDGDHHFLDRFNLATRESERLLRSGRESLERFMAFPGPGDDSFLTWYQSPTTPPNAFLRTHRRARPPKRRCSDRGAWPSRASPIQRQRCQGGHVSGSQATFTRLHEDQLPLLPGYALNDRPALIDRASFPVIGDPAKPYDAFIAQLVSEAKAAVDEAYSLVDSSGVVPGLASSSPDRRRLVLPSQTAAGLASAPCMGAIPGSYIAGCRSAGSVGRRARPWIRPIRTFPAVQQKSPGMSASA